MRRAKRARQHPSYRVDTHCQEQAQSSPFAGQTHIGAAYTPHVGLTCRVHPPGSPASAVLASNIGTTSAAKRPTAKPAFTVRRLNIQPSQALPFRFVKHVVWWGSLGAPYHYLLKTLSDVEPTLRAKNKGVEPTLSRVEPVLSSLYETYNGKNSDVEPKRMQKPREKRIAKSPHFMAQRLARR